jgi:membrane-associated phospholipid phosphatase
LAPSSRRRSVLGTELPIGTRHLGSHRDDRRTNLATVWWWLPSLVLVVMVGRVYVGAHNPLDVTAGLGAGMMLGGVMASLVG